MESIVTSEETCDSTTVEVQLLIEPLNNNEAKKLLDLIVNGNYIHQILTK